MQTLACQTPEKFYKIRPWRWDRVGEVTNLKSMTPHIVAANVVSSLKNKKWIFRIKFDLKIIKKDLLKPWFKNSTDYVCSE